MSSKHKTLADLFLHGLKDIHFAQRHVAKTLAKLAKAARSKPLEHAFEAHRDTILRQADRLDEVFTMLGKKPHETDCEATLGLVSETKDVMASFEDSEAIDFALLAAAQAMDHYLIARTAALRAWSSHLGHGAASTLFDQTLAEEKTALETWAASAASLSTADQAGGEPASAPLTLKTAALLGLQ